MSKEVLIVDDEAAIREVVAAVLEDEGYVPRQAATSDEALREVARKPPALLLLDIWLEGSRMDGVQILDHVRSSNPSLPVIMFSGHGTIETAVAAIKKGALDFIEKPFKSDRLLVAVERAMELSRLRRENEELRSRAQKVELIGSSPVMPIERLVLRRSPDTFCTPTLPSTFSAGPSSASAWRHTARAASVSASARRNAGLAASTPSRALAMRDVTLCCHHAPCAGPVSSLSGRSIVNALSPLNTGGAGRCGALPQATSSVEAENRTGPRSNSANLRLIGILVPCTRSS